MKRTCILICFVSMALSAPTALGALIAYEGFDYPNDSATLNAKTGGTGWSAGWVSTSPNLISHTADDVSLDTASYQFDPIGDRTFSRRSDQGGGQGVALRQWAGIAMNQDDRVLYYSFLAKKLSEIPGSTSSANVEVDIGTNTTSTAMRAGMTSNNALFVTGSGAAAQVNTADDYFQEGVTYLIVAKIVSKAAANQDKIYAVAYGPNDNVPLLEPTTWTVENTLQLNALNDRARLWVGAAADGEIDELRLGQTWEDVVGVPEPSSTLLMAICIAVGLGYRRLRR